jgi:threonine 3-dehydrogenase
MPKMKAIVKTKAAPGAELIETDTPLPGPDQVLVKVLASSICGTDLHIYQWNDWAKKRIKHIPQILGHEVCGEITEIGANVNPDSLKVGDTVSAETHIGCGWCFECRTGNAHICLNSRIFGVDVHGVFAEYAVVPAANAWVLEKKIPKDFGSVMEPLGNAVHTVLAGPICGATVLITGCGPIGLMAIAVSRLCGATKIFATEVNEYRLQLAKKLGADFALNPQKDDVREKIREETNDLGVDAVLEMSGNGSAINEGLKALRPGGRFSMLGLPEQPLKIDLNEVIFKYLTLQGINGRLMFDTWYKSSRFLSSGRLDLSPIITHRLRLEEFEKGMELMESGNCGKVLLYP